MAEVRRAQELDPLPLVIDTNVGWGLLIKGQYHEAVAQLRKTIEMDGSFYYARYILGQALQLSGHIAEAEKEYKKATELATDPVPLATGSPLRDEWAKEGRQKGFGSAARNAKATLRRCLLLAIAYLGLGDC